jgi:hypothetical protein
MSGVVPLLYTICLCDMNRDDLAFIREIWCADIHWIHLTQDRYQWLFRVNLVTERRNP